MTAVPQLKREFSKIFGPQRIKHDAVGTESNPG